MGRTVPTEPSAELMEQIIKDFGSYDNFKNQFIEASKAVEASRLVFVSMGRKVAKARNIAMWEASKFDIVGL